MHSILYRQHPKQQVLIVVNLENQNRKTVTGGKFGYSKNPGGRVKIIGIFGRRKSMRTFFKIETGLFTYFNL
jgi:hypothetical protein